MRTSDIDMAPYVTDNFKTEGMYIVGDRKMADMDDKFLRRNLCHRSGGDLKVCAACSAPCTVGKLLLQRQTEGDNHEQQSRNATGRGESESKPYEKHEPRCEEGRADPKRHHGGRP